VAGEDHQQRVVGGLAHEAPARLGYVERLVAALCVQRRMLAPVLEQGVHQE
jgi:hypothetical protein